MQKYLGALSSDTVSRDGYLITFEALEKGIADNAVKGIPSLIEHDFHRPLGWNFPFGILIEPKISRTIGNFIVCENESDKELIYPRIQNYWHNLNYEDCINYQAEFKELLQDNFSDEGVFIFKSCVAYNNQNIVKKQFPKLFDKVDKSGLIYLDEILAEFDYIGCGIFKNKNNDFSIFCHQYFRRNLSLLNNYNTYFIDEFIKLHSNKEIKLRIAIDPNLIGLSKTFRGFLEFDYWWGPKFNDDISSLPNQVTRYECNDEQKFYSGVLGTEFWWKTDENEKTLEVEEIREKPSLGINKESYGCRYIHSIYDNKNSEFIHFDGAVRLYSEDQIIERWETNINKAGKNTDYTKLFRIDGKLQLADWKKLCILYYKNNPLLFEYFGAKEEYENLKKQPNVNLNWENNYYPYKIAPEDGVRLFVSYHKKDEKYTSFDRKIINPSVLDFQNGKTLSVVEYDIIEIEKYLKRIGEKLIYSEDISFIKPFDFYTNYPIILHGSINTEKLVQNTLNAFKTIFNIQNQKINKTISFTLGWEMENFETRISVYGKSSEIIKWLELNPKVPIEYEEFRKWMIKQREWIYTYNYKNKDLASILKDDGKFYINRKFINQELISFQNTEPSGNFHINVNRGTELDTLIQQKKVFPSYIGLIKKASCSKTKENYFISETSKYLDDDTYMIIEEIEFLDFFWTDEIDNKSIISIE
ncbi:hypothetical protein [Chryseobacterium arthrosphaerae]|uniref:hypothetical protein n=1 Tax=Chryseobacterium arthrosphaerae TaxID=651561 RepID=UPI001F4BC4E6|nr:hypothetical protein [Chryseobacterium arthrosphaerae]